MGVTRRQVLAGAAISVATKSIARRASARTGAASLILDDASGLSATKVAKHVVFQNDPDESLVAALRAELAEAASAGRAVIASAARHTMGGHSLPLQGTAITLEQAGLALDKSGGVYRVSAGARWRDVIRLLDAEGWSPAVMQSNNDFGVASTFCVNAHGWPVAFGPFGATVRSFRMMLASGEVVDCSRERHPELFCATMGGYGLTGIILDLDVEMVRNERLDPSFEQLAAAQFGPRFVSVANNPQTRMAYGRLDVRPHEFLDEALIVSYRPSEDQSELPTAAGSGFLSRASRWIFRGQLGSDWVKGVRWRMESSLAPRLYGQSTRNSLLNEPVITLDDRDPTRTDILHEYFIAPERFADSGSRCSQTCRTFFWAA